MSKARRLFIAIATFFLMFALAMITTRPKNDLNWEKQFVRQTNISQNENVFKLENVKDWRYESDRVVSYGYTSREYNPDNVENVWLLVEPFGDWDGVAHTYFTFDFTDAPPVSFTIEARREADEGYSAWDGLFRKYELIYMWGTEEDLLVRRAVHLDHDVYMYPLDIPETWKKNWFLKLTEETEKLNKNPRFYNTLFSNCTNTLANMANDIRPGTVPWHPARVLTGFSDEYLYSLGYIPNNKPLEEIKEKYYVTDIVKANYQKENFSQILRDAIMNK